MLRGGYPLAPAVLGLILGPMIETNYRRALSLSSGSHSVFLESPISLVLLLLAAVSFAAPAVRGRVISGRTRAPEPGPEAHEAPEAPKGPDAHDNQPRHEEHE